MTTKIGIRQLGAPPKPIAKRTPPRRVTTRPLTPKQRAFVERYMLSLNATKAYQESHPDASWVTANQAGSMLMRDPRIAKEVKARLAAVTKRYRLTANRILSEFAALAFSNVQDFYDCEGRLLAIDELPAYAAAAVRKVKTREITVPAGEGKASGTAVLQELELHDKMAALRMIGQHLGLFDSPPELTLGKDFAELLREARARIAPPAPIEGEVAK